MENRRLQNTLVSIWCHMVAYGGIWCHLVFQRYDHRLCMDLFATDYVQNNPQIEHLGSNRLSLSSPIARLQSWYSQHFSLTGQLGVSVNVYNTTYLLDTPRSRRSTCGMLGPLPPGAGDARLVIISSLPRRCWPVGGDTGHMLLLYVASSGRGVMARRRAFPEWLLMYVLRAQFSQIRDE